MCGIFGFVSATDRSPQIVVDGLRRLEYRGYDSWGIATLDGPGELHVVKHVGKISRTSDKDFAELGLGRATIGHTRWATHGPPNVANAHPHLSKNGRIAVVHNGIIENYRPLRTHLEGAGFAFRSETDTEVVAHLIEYNRASANDFHEALTRTLQELHGTFGLVVLNADEPERIYAARLGSPLVVGLGEQIQFISSDPNSLVAHTNEVIYLDEAEWAEITPTKVSTFDFDRSATLNAAQHLDLKLAQTELGSFPHYMLKEIYEQPQAIRDAIRGRLLFSHATVQLAGLEGLKLPERVKIIACGSSWHAGLVGRQYFEDLARLPAEVEYASEFRYRNVVIEPNTLVIAISQSGETADTLAGLRESLTRGATALGVVNVVGSSIARECGRGVYLHAGPEFGVAATKSFVNQLVILFLLAVYFGRQRGMTLRQGIELLNLLEQLPDLITQFLDRQEAKVKEVVKNYVQAQNFLYTGRSFEYPIALEGALKLKEVSYIHAEGLPAAELKHGPIALITKEMPTVVMATQSRVLDKVVSNVQEIRARGGEIIAIIREGNEALHSLADHDISVPSAPDVLSPMLATIPVQLIAYHLAVLRGCDVDQPRNLAKSVTVE